MAHKDRNGLDVEAGVDIFLTEGPAQNPEVELDADGRREVTEDDPQRVGGQETAVEGREQGRCVSL